MVELEKSPRKQPQNRCIKYSGKILENKHRDIQYKNY